MKNPNGYGCVKHLSGSRRNPFAFVVTDHGKQIVKGYFPTKMDALAYQVEYWNTHGRTRLSEITLEELYAEWLPAHRPYVAEKMILGHARHDVTNGVYTHKTSRQLRKAIEKI